MAMIVIPRRATHQKNGLRENSRVLESSVGEA